MVKIRESAKATLEEEMKTERWVPLRCDCERFARSIMSQHSWRGMRGGVPPGGYGAEDIVEIVIIKTIREKIKCKCKDKELELKTFLFMNIWSAVSNMVRSSENKCVLAEQYFVSKDRENCDPVDIISSQTLNRQNNFLDELEEKEVHELIMEYLHSIEKDTMLSKIAKILIIGKIVFPECFCRIVSDVHGLVRNLNRYGYIDEAGVVQDAFWRLEGCSEMRLYKKFCAEKNEIYCVLLRSTHPDLEIPMRLAKWLNIDPQKIYYLRKRLRVSLWNYLSRFNKEELEWIICILRSRQKECMLCSVLPGLKPKI